MRIRRGDRPPGGTTARRRPNAREARRGLRRRGQENHHQPASALRRTELDLCTRPLLQIAPSRRTFRPSPSKEVRHG